MVWTNVPKPSSTTYSNVNPAGKEQYDQSTLIYDSTDTYYDGINPNMWTGVAKPASSSWTNVNKPT